MSLQLASDSFAALEPRATYTPSQCFTVHGYTVSSDIVPCNAVLAAQGEGSMCCSIGADSKNDTCHPTGLCLNGGNWWRDFCSDPTWSSPNCLKGICMDQNDFGSNDSFSQVYSCGGNDSGNPTYCCGNGRTSSCCSNSTAVFSLKATLVGSNGSAATVTVTATSSASASSNGTNGAAIGLGVTLGVVVVAALAGILFLLRKLRALAKNQAGGPMGQQAQGGYDTPKNNYGATNYNATNFNTNQYHEVPAGPPPAVEMPSYGQQGYKPPGT